MREKVYKINTINDFLKIPIERLPICLKEFAKTIMTAKAIYDIHETLGTLVDKNTIELPLTWIDDDKGNLEVNIKTTINKKM